MFGSKQWNFFSKNLHENRVWFPVRSGFVLDHGRCDVKRKLFVKFLARSQFVVDVV